MHANDLSSRKILDSILSEWKVDKVQIWDMNLEKQHLFASIVFFREFFKNSIYFFPFCKSQFYEFKTIALFSSFLAPCDVILHKNTFVINSF